MTDDVHVPRTWPGTYRLPAAQLLVPEAAPTLTLEAFSPYAGQRVEAACFWYGPRSESGDGVVEAVVVTKQINRPRSYDIGADAMAAVFEATSDRDWRNLCQIHSHPGRIVEHSFYDDDNANSRRALSFVLPDYGSAATWPDGMAVHEFQDGEWHLLNPEQAGARIVYGHSGGCELVDLR